MAFNVEKIITKAQKHINEGDFQKANSVLIKVLNKNPGHPQATNLKALIALRTGDLDTAITLYSELLEIAPNNTSLEYNLGLAYLRSAEFELAVTHIENAIKINPNLDIAYSDLCLALMKCDRLEAAVNIGKIAVKKTPNNPNAHYNLALSCDRIQYYDTSLEHYEIAAALLPNHPGIQSDLGNAYTGQGKKDLAIKCYENVLKHHPLNAPTLRNITRITKYTTTDHEDIHRFKKMLANKQLSSEHRTDAFFALGKIYQDCKQYDEAFFYFSEGNKIEDEKLKFNPDDFTKFIDRTIEVCNKDFFEKIKSSGNQSKSPVFIIGTPRSGTTLVEQIVSSHKNIFGAGELAWIDSAASSLPGFLKSPDEFPECLRDINTEAIKSLSNKYLTYISNLSQGESMVTDKMPANFMLLGLIRVLFPNAKIIHCTRNPRDSCISMFTQYFPDCVPFSYDLYKLGIFYSQYERLMTHWKTTLPKDAILDINYESLISNQEEESKRLIAFLDIEWDESCLSFYKGTRRVHTASDLQVSKPIYKSSVERWKVYEKFLGPLEAGFRDGKK